MVASKIVRYLMAIAVTEVTERTLFENDISENYDINFISFFIANSCISNSIDSHDISDTSDGSKSNDTFYSS